MSKEVSFKNRDRFFQLGITIATLRKLRGLSQEKLAEKANISRSLLSAIEAPNLAHSFSLEVFFDLADALEVDPAALLNASAFPDSLLKGKSGNQQG
ncbi:MAG: helix-turn-helix transcriptional regulator [Oscillospiraceae bacterium]|nr:helix-turn-helix transcriptional regulator [Oscillospiraceae bacterium]